MTGVLWRSRQAVAAACAILGLAFAAHAQFGTPSSTQIRERVTGAVLLAEGEAEPDVGDQVGAFFNNEIVGVFAFTSATGTEEFSLLVFGDDPATTTVEGPRRGQVVQIRYFDSSTDTDRTDVRLENSQGEGVTYRYGGEELPPLPIDLPGLDLTPTRSLNLRIGVEAGDGGDGDGDGDSGIAYDVDNNGKVDTHDAAMVLRIIVGASSAVPDDVLDRADVNEDNLVNTQDVVEIIRNQ